VQDRHRIHVEIIGARGRAYASEGQGRRRNERGTEARENARNREEEQERDIDRCVIYIYM